MQQTKSVNNNNEQGKAVLACKQTSKQASNALACLVNAKQPQIFLKTILATNNTLRVETNPAQNFETCPRGDTSSTFEFPRNYEPEVHSRRCRSFRNYFIKPAKKRKRGRPRKRKCKKKKKVVDLTKTSNEKKVRLGCSAGRETRWPCNWKMLSTTKVAAKNRNGLIGTRPAIASEDYDLQQVGSGRTTSTKKVRLSSIFASGMQSAGTCFFDLSSAKKKVAAARNAGARRCCPTPLCDIYVKVG